MVRGNTDHNYATLRGRCRDLGFDASDRFRDATGKLKRHRLSGDEMKDAIKRLELAVAVKSKYGSGHAVAPVVLHMFWAPSSGKLTDTCAIPSYAKLGMHSAVACGYDVRLWAYSSTLNGVPSGVSVCMASDLVPLGDAQHWLTNGLRIQHLADIVRLYAVRKHGESTLAGPWFADVDVIWLRRVERTPSLSGHMFASMHARHDSIAWTNTQEEKMRQLKENRVPVEQPVSDFRKVTPAAADSGS